MAIRDLLWACPNCKAFGALRAGKRRTDVCVTCHSRFRRHEGAAIQSELPGGATETRPARVWLERLPSIEDHFPPASDELLGPERASVRTVAGFRPVHDGIELLGWAERMGPRLPAVVSLTGDEIIVQLEDRTETTPLTEIRSIQPTSSSLQIGRRSLPMMALRFETASIRLWERVLQIRVANAYARSGRGDVVEFQPVIRVCDPLRTALDPEHRPQWLVGDSAVRQAEPPGSAAAERAQDPWQGQPERAGMVYRVCQWIVRNAWRRLGGFEINGYDRIPASGPFLLVSNHQSDLDPPLVQSIIQRPVFAVAKSGLFTAPVIGWLMRRLHSIPVRRYQVDAQAVRVALRLMSRGHGVAIYIEGERSWDGALQDYRPGTIRLALKAGVPVIPVAVSGTFDASPRWDSRIRPRPVRIEFLEPIRFARLDDRIQREAVVGEAAELIMSRLEEALRR